VTGHTAPHTINPMPDGTLKAWADLGELGAELAIDGGDCERVLADFGRAGIRLEVLAAQLQDEGAKAFSNSWNELLGVIQSKSSSLARAS
jgi:transaldolase